MHSKIIVFLILLAMAFIGNIFANDTIRFALEITGINVNQGQLYVKIYSNDRDYRNDIPCVAYVLEDTSQSIVYSFDILEGEYLIALFQDTNNNGKLDTKNNNSNRVTINIGRV